MIDFRSVWEHMTALAWVAFRSFVGTVSVFAIAGLVMAAASYYFLKANALYAFLFALLAIIEAVSAGVFIGSKRAIVLALAHGVVRVQLGRSVLGLCFDRLLKVTSEDPFGARGTQVALAVERLPLAQAERRLVAVIDDLMRSSPSGNPITGWFRRLLHKRMLRLIQHYTLAQFREEGTRQGGVDLLKVRADLERGIDEILIRRLKRGINLWMFGLLFALAAVVSAQTYIALVKLYAQ
jgi:hypothetical protein